MSSHREAPEISKGPAAEDTKRHGYPSHEESFSTRLHPAHVVFEIGQDFGALVLYMAEADWRREVEISPIGDDSHRLRTTVLRRKMSTDTVYAAVYPELSAGRWRLWADDPRLQQEVTITGGAIAEVDWR